MGMLKRMLAGAAVVAGMVSGGEVPGLPGDFGFVTNPFRGGTAWFLDAGHARLYRDGDGRAMCSYLYDLEFPAYRDGRTGAHYCPGITVRHLYRADIVRTGGKCRGFVCGYDIAIPGGGAQLTTDRVAYCPDIVATVAQGGRMDVVAAKTFRAGEDATPYFRNGALIDMLLTSEDILVDSCGGERYRGQLAYWLGTAEGPDTELTTETLDNPGWDGF